MGNFDSRTAPNVKKSGNLIASSWINFKLKDLFTEEEWKTLVSVKPIDSINYSLFESVNSQTDSLKWAQIRNGWKETESLIEDLSKSANTEVDYSKVNNLNDEYFEALVSLTPGFVNLLRTTDFEDGMHNECSRLAEIYIEKNWSATFNWFNYIYTQYQDDERVLASLLRTISLLRIKHHEDLLGPIIAAGLSHPSTATQEAAIMVIENFRNMGCLKALRNARFTSAWVKGYAEAVKKELEEELGG